MTGRRSRALILAVTVSLLAMTTVVRADAASPPQDPGVSEQELPAFGNTIVGTPTAVPLFIGAATAAQPGAVSISSIADFTQEISAPSPALLAAIQQFYDNDGGVAFVLPVKTEDVPTFSAALAAAAPAGASPPGWEVLVIPALGALTPTDWLTTATEMTAAASNAQAMAILDPPDATVAAAQTAGAAPLTALAAQLRGAVQAPGNAFLLSSGLTDTDNGNPVPGAAVAAAILAESDEHSGVWATPGGLGDPVVSAQPVLTVDDDLDQDLYPYVDAWRVIPGTGTILFDTRTLAGFGPEQYINQERTTNWIKSSVDLALEQYVFAANDAETWENVSASITGFLTGVWQAGGLVGPNVTDAFTVNVGVPSTMTALDVLNGLMIVDVVIRIDGIEITVPLQFVQQMQSDG